MLLHNPLQSASGVNCTRQHRAHSVRTRLHVSSEFDIASWEDVPIP